MPIKIKYSLLIPLAIATMLMVLMQSACNKDKEYISEGDFINSLKGDWYVYNFYSDVSYVMIILNGDSIEYRGNDGRTSNYSVHDPMICTLLGMENMQNWTITENNNKLMLKTQDLCNGIKNYTIEYYNYRRSIGERIFGIKYFTGVIYADVNLIGSDTTISLQNFQIITDIEPASIRFTMVKNEVFGNFDLNRM